VAEEDLYVNALRPGRMEASRTPLVTLPDEGPRHAFQIPLIDDEERFGLAALLHPAATRQKKADRSLSWIVGGSVIVAAVCSGLGLLVQLLR